MTHRDETDDCSVEPLVLDEDAGDSLHGSDNPPDDISTVTSLLLAIAKQLVTNLNQKLADDFDRKILPSVGDLSRLYQLVDELGENNPPSVLEVRWVKTIVNPTSPS